MLGVPSAGMPRGGLLCSKGGLEEKKQVSADSSGTWGLTAAPCFHVSPGRAPWAPSSKHVVHLQRNVNTDPFYLTLNHGSFLLFISEHIEKPSTSAPQTPSFHFQVPATVTFAQLCANQAQSSQKLLFLSCLGPGLMLLLYFSLSLIFIWGKICFPGGSDGKKSLPPMQETWIRSLGWEDTLKKGMATHPSILARRIPWTEEPGGPQSMGLQSWT